MSKSTLYVDNTGFVKLLGLRDHLNNYQNDATVVLESLIDKVTGNNIGGLSLPLTLDYVAGSDGDYQALLAHNISVTAGQILEATVSATGSQGYRGEWVETVTVIRRTG